MPWISGFLFAVLIWFLFFKAGEAGVGDLIVIAILTIVGAYLTAAFDWIVEWLEKRNKK